MGATSNPRRALAGYLTVAAGIALLFGVVALAALRPADGLAWVRLPQLGADFGLDPGLGACPPLRSGPRSLPTSYYLWCSWASWAPISPPAWWPVRWSNGSPASWSKRRTRPWMARPTFRPARWPLSGWSPTRRGSTRRSSGLINPP